MKYSFQSSSSQGLLSNNYPRNYFTAWHLFSCHKNISNEFIKTNNLWKYFNGVPHLATFIFVKSKHSLLIARFKTKKGKMSCHWKKISRFWICLFQFLLLGVHLTLILITLFPFQICLFFFQHNHLSSVIL